MNPVIYPIGKGRIHQVSGQREHGDYVTTDDGLKGEVSSVNVLRQLVKVLVEVNDEKELREYQADQLKFKPKRRRDVKLTAEEMKELAALEDRGGKSKIDDTK